MKEIDLRGLRILNTRPHHQGASLTQAITQAGGLAVTCPALAIEPTPTEWLSSLQDINRVQQAIFTSANAVHYFFTPLQQAQITWPSSITIIAVGQQTANALQNVSIEVDFIPPESDSEHLLALPSLHAVHGQTILLVKGEGGRTLIGETLVKHRANAIEITVYRRTMPEPDHELITGLWRNDAVDIILFTSEQAMRNVFTFFGEQAKHWLCDKPCLVLSRRLAQTASLLGIKTVIISRPETIIDALHQFNQGFTHGKQQ
ncbi:uroporphyrinogen-III synthase [Legionella spiritensis]|uniref:Uroporphyrinogen-III synthase n=1 Tax=Legionella spiritensis TaxID=452 RepID=A0A0W0Z5G0_LEGSP|nr:uroporphyrinogen-III synthase [Legionella spiritensis]KTD64349.1 uroporphyrinogen-III synthase [Legionella spiritensis]SNV46407.1 uroporphyrinogen III methylase [Legionella spiritensis]